MEVALCACLMHYVSHSSKGAAVDADTAEILDVLIAMKSDGEIG